MFDDSSSQALTLDGFRVERRALGPGDLAVYCLRYQNSNGRFAGVSGDEQRNAVDVHYSGKMGAIDFDVEAMGQQGRIGTRPVLAWAFGEVSGYTLTHVAWQPCFSFQVDAASGNRSGTGTSGTFNPLFPNGSYFNLSGLTGYANFVHLKPGISIAPGSGLRFQLSAGFQWRQTTQDAIYTFPAQSVANTAGHGSLWSAAYVQFDAVKQINANAALSVEVTCYEVGSTIRQAGGHDSTYANFQVSVAW